MANPFPGMDPYLEGCIWQCVHANTATDVARFLAPRIEPKYVALTTERFVVSERDDIDDQLHLPDVVVSDESRRADCNSLAKVPLVARAVHLAAVPQFSVEIRDQRDRRLITSMVAVSPSIGNCRPCRTLASSVGPIAGQTSKFGRWPFETL